MDTFTYVLIFAFIAVLLAIIYLTKSSSFDEDSTQQKLKELDELEAKYPEHKAEFDIHRRALKEERGVSGYEAEGYENEGGDMTLTLPRLGSRR